MTSRPTPPGLARSTVLAEAVTARAAIPAETEALRLGPGIPLLRILRTTRSGTNGTVLEINDTRLPRRPHEVGYHLRRSRTAR